jgi:hypothetical protein
MTRAGGTGHILPPDVGREVLERCPAADLTAIHDPRLGPGGRRPASASSVWRNAARSLARTRIASALTGTRKAALQRRRTIPSTLSAKAIIT